MKVDKGALIIIGKFLNSPFSVLNSQGGQALITLLVFTVMASMIITGAVAVTMINSQATGILADSEDAFKVAEAGLDNAALRLIRNPAYTGETLTVGSGTATINVNSGARTITSIGNSGNYQRTIQASYTDTGNVVAISSWQEI